MGGKWQRRNELPIDDALAISYVERWDRARPWRITDTGDRELAPYPTHEEALALVRLGRRNVYSEYHNPPQGRWKK